MSRSEQIEAESEYDKRLHGPQTAQGRLREWARSRHWPEVNVWPEESAMYALLHNPGRATNTQSDGGMASMAENMEGSIRTWTRTQEVSDALFLMPVEYRKVIDAMYRVERRERPRRVEHAAEITKLKVPTYRKMMDLALVWLQGRLCIEHSRRPQDMGVDSE